MRKKVLIIYKLNRIKIFLKKNSPPLLKKSKNFPFFPPLYQKKTKYMRRFYKCVKNDEN